MAQICQVGPLRGSGGAKATIVGVSRWLPPTKTHINAPPHERGTFQEDSAPQVPEIVLKSKRQEMEDVPHFSTGCDFQYRHLIMAVNKGEQPLHPTILGQK